MGDSPGHPRNVHEQAWKDHLRLLAAALLDELFEQPAGTFSSCPTSLARRGIKEEVLAQCARSNEEIADPRDVAITLHFTPLRRGHSRILSTLYQQHTQMKYQHLPSHKRK